MTRLIGRNIKSMFCIFGSCSVVLYHMKPYFLYPFRILSGMIMLLALICLSLGTCFIYTEHQKQSKTEQTSDTNDDTAKPTSNPFDNTEDKAENCSTNLAAEYLMEVPGDFYRTNIPLKHLKSPHTDAFTIFHGESFSPPPEQVI